MVQAVHFRSSRLVYDVELRAILLASDQKARQRFRIAPDRDERLWGIRISVTFAHDTLGRRAKATMEMKTVRTSYGYCLSSFILSSFILSSDIVSICFLVFFLLFLSGILSFDILSFDILSSDILSCDFVSSDILSCALSCVGATVVSPNVRTSAISCLFMRVSPMLFLKSFIIRVDEARRLNPYSAWPRLDQSLALTSQEECARSSSWQRRARQFLRRNQLSRWTIEQLIEKPELPNLPPPGPVISPSCAKVRIWNSSRTCPRKPLLIAFCVHSNNWASHAGL